MTDYGAWLAANERALAQALDDVRLRLEHLAGENAPAQAVAPVALPFAAPPEHPSFLGRLFGARDAGTPSATAPTPSAVAETTSPPPIALAAAQDVASETAGEASSSFRPALDLIAERLGLSPFERDVLLLCAAMEFDTRIPALCARAQRDPSKPYPTFALALAMSESPAWDALTPARPLRYWRLIEINQPGAVPLIGAALHADERIVSYIKGLNYLDDRLAPMLASLPTQAPDLPPSQRAIGDEILAGIRATDSGAAQPLIQLLGSDGVSKRSVAQYVGSALGVQVQRLSADMLPASVADQETLLRLWQRESRLLPLALYLDAADLDRGDAHAALARRFVTRVGGLVFVDTRETWSGQSVPGISVDVAKPTAQEQREAWQSQLGAGAAAHAPELSGHFDFNIDTIQRVARGALAASTPETLATTLRQGALANARPSLDQLAQRIDAKAGWNDIQLAAPDKSLLRQVANQVAMRAKVYDDWGFRARMNRGLAVSALFAGESGTGKTMAAEVLARELGLLLYRIDLSAVVSKYIGETEKNLRKLFDAAEDGGAILFFDEADALFGRRSEVKDSHDRYANIEVNYLLQRMESYRGLAILATNMKSALDSAFMRRLRFIINFAFPGIAERKAIWSNVFPLEAGANALDLERLARLALTGGSIQSIALNAAFMAAQAGAKITMPLVLDAARAEFRKLEKPVNEADFRWLESAGGAA